ncbi:MAG: phosphatase PAP2 family protein [Ignavibacteria bacterium]|jgi:undecaprenyl-diphosphatase|nr:phosphatase PAP2 family protein [Ignavibacteria bacterium]MCU7501817.1 phosphatase PAP2 family protein [Ignavibacteria bacterium]MCU7514837.1 phosphatase PAP2 family protein [Ignavibacteria bacterium]
MRESAGREPLYRRIFGTYAPSEIRIVFTVLFMTLGILIFLLITGIVVSGNTRQLDELVVTALREPGDYSKPVGPRALIGIMRDVTSLGGATFVTLTTVIVIIYLLLEKKRRSLMLVLLATLGGGMLETFLKSLIARQRPSAVFQLMPEYSHSFPSGHSMMSAVVYLSLAVLIARIQKRRVIRIYVIAVALFLTFIIGISRIYLGVHYPTDVLAGWALGLAWASFVWFLSWKLELRDKSGKDLIKDEEMK